VVLHLICFRSQQPQQASESTNSAADDKSNEKTHYNDKNQQDITSWGHHLGHGLRSTSAGVASSNLLKMRGTVKKLVAVPSSGRYRGKSLLVI
jgi:hypothetical protein